MSETIKDIIDVISCCCGCQGNRIVFIVAKPAWERFPDSPGASLYIEREEVSLAQLRDRLIKAYRYEHDEPAKRLLELILQAFDNDRFSVMVDLFQQARGFLARTSKEFKPTKESEVAK